MLKPFFYKVYLVIIFLSWGITANSLVVSNTGGKCHSLNVSRLKGEVSPRGRTEELARELFLSGEYKKSLTLLTKSYSQFGGDNSLRGLIAAVAIAIGKNNVAKKYLNLIVSEDSAALWANLDLFRLGSISSAQLLKLTCNVAVDKSTLFGCAKIFKNNKIIFNKLIKKTLQAAEKDIKDPFSLIVIAKSKEEMGDKLSSITVLNQVKSSSPSYVAALREKVRIYSDLGEYGRGQDSLNRLLLIDNQDPVNNLIALDFYVKLNKPYGVLASYLKAKKCLSPTSNDLLARKGYVLEVIGQPINDKNSIYASVNSFMSYFLPSELMQNKALGFSSNLYYFRNNQIKLGWRNELKKNYTLAAELGLNYKQGQQKESEYYLGLALDKRMDFGRYFVNNLTTVSYVPVQSHLDNEFLRHSYTVSNLTNIKSKKSSKSYHVKLSFGSEKLLRTNSISDFKEASFMRNQKFFNSKLEVPMGFIVKDISSEDVSLQQYKFFVGGNYSLSSRFYVKSYNEVFTISEADVYSLYQSLKLIYAASSTGNISVDVSNETDLNEDKFGQMLYGLSLSNDFHFGYTKIKAILDFKRLKNYGHFKNSEMFVNFKVGLPF